MNSSQAVTITPHYCATAPQHGDSRVCAACTQSLACPECSNAPAQGLAATPALQQWRTVVSHNNTAKLSSASQHSNRSRSQRPTSHVWSGVQVLHLPSRPYLGTKLGTFEHDKMLLLQGVGRGGALPIRMGLLPGDPAEPCTVNLAHPPDHPFWQIASAEELYEYLEQEFPAVDTWRELVPHERAEQFVRRRTGVFRHPQTCRRLVHVQESARAPPAAEGLSDRFSGCGVVLLGDAAHTFPPGARPAVPRHTRRTRCD